MNFEVVLLIVISSVFHVIWNMLGKRSVPSAAFFMITSFSIVLLLFPVCIAYGGSIVDMPYMWKFFVPAGLFQAVYYTGLAGGYRYGDMSAAYPFARALPVVTVPLIGAIMGVGRSPDFISTAGMVIVFSGCILLPQSESAGSRISRYFSRSTLFVIMAAAGTTGYTLVDSTGVSFLGEHFPGPDRAAILVSALYLFFEMFTALIFISIYVLSVKQERRELCSIIKKKKLYGFSAGFLILAAYGIVLITYPMVTNVSYVTAFRQISIPLGVAAGILFLKEKPGIWKLAGSALISAGLILVYL